MKPAKIKDLRRRPPARNVNKTILIVCEGAKTEPYYLREMVRDYGIHGEVEVTGNCGSAPISVVDKAIELFGEAPRYDFVYCVFDRDTHSTFKDAVAKVRGHQLVRMEKGVVAHKADFIPITSTPCFEFWILLHYSASAAPMQNFTALLPKLKKIPGYQAYNKGMPRLYELLKPLTDVAIANAQTVRTAALANGSPNPLTDMDILVGDLGRLRKRF